MRFVNDACLLAGELVTYLQADTAADSLVMAGAAPGFDAPITWLSGYPECNNPPAGYIVP